MCQATITCPNEIHHVVANNHSTGAEAFPAIKAVGGTVSIYWKSQHGYTTLPFNVWLTDLKIIWSEPPGTHFGGLGEALHCGKSTDAIQQEVH